MARRPLFLCRLGICFTLLSALVLGCQDAPDANLDDRSLEEYGNKANNTGIYQRIEGGGGTMEPIVTSGTATIRGTATLNGPMPSIDTNFSAKFTQDKAYCTCDPAKAKGDDEQYTWKIDGGKVKNVVVFVKPFDEKTQFFKFDDVAKTFADLKIKKEVVIDQPFCAYDPHVAILFNKYVDPTNPGENREFANFKRTPQTFEIKNDATIGHNSKYGGYFSGSVSGNAPIPSKGSLLLSGSIQPFYRDAYSLSCTIHPWMQAYFWSFPHPYAAITDDKGNFEIKGVPAGAKIRLCAWHEAGGWLLGGGPDGVVIELKDKDTMTQDVQVSAR